MKTRDRVSATDERRATLIAAVVVSVSTLSLLYILRHDVPYPPALRLAVEFFAFGAPPLAAMAVLSARGRGGALLAAVVALVAVALLVALSARFARVVALSHLGYIYLAVLLLTAFLVALTWRARSDWGIAPGDWRWWVPRVALLAVLIVPLAVVSVKLFPDLKAFYARRSAYELDFPLRLAGYALYMLAWEFHFRGFLLFGLAKRTGGIAAAFLQAAPFAFMHFGKPEPELFASFAGGVLLGLLCWRGRSFLPGFILHTCLITANELAVRAVQ